MESLIDDGEGREQLEMGNAVTTGWYCGNCKKQVLVKDYPDNFRAYCDCLGIGLGPDLATYRKKAGVKGGFAPRKVA